MALLDWNSARKVIAFGVFAALLSALAWVGAADDARREREQLQSATERLRQQIRAHHGVDARVTCTEAGDIRDIRCVVVVRDTTHYFRCDRYYLDSLCLPAIGGAR